MILSFIFSVVEKHSRQVCFLTFSSKLVETRSKPYFGGTILKSRSREDVDKSYSIAPSAKPKEQSFSLKLVCGSIFSIIWRWRRWFFIVISYFIFIFENRGKFPYVSLFVGNMSFSLKKILLFIAFSLLFLRKKTNSPPLMLVLLYRGSWCLTLNVYIMWKPRFSSEWVFSAISV